MSISHIEDENSRADGTAITRRVLLRGAAAAGGLGFLAACSSNGAAGGASGSSATGGGGSPSAGASPTSVRTSVSGGSSSASASTPSKASTAAESSGAPSGAKGLNAIFGPGGKPAGQGLTIQAGMLLAMTGAGSFYGKVMSHGAQLAAAQIKAAGGFDYHISIGDHKSGEVPAALSATRQMITQNHIEVLQTSYGAPSEAIVPLIAQNKVLSFNGGGSSPGQVGKPYLWQTRMLFGDDPCPGGLAWVHKHFPKAKRLAIIGTQENGVAGAKTIGPECWKNLTGGPVVANLQHQVGATDYSSIIAKVKAQNPDAILTFSYGNDVGYEIKQFREANVTVPIMGIDFTAQAATIAGKTIDTYNFSSDYYDVNGPSPFNRILVDGHRKMFGNDPEYYGANYYEQVFFVWQIVRRVLAEGGNPLDSAQLEKNLEKDPTFYTVYGGTSSETATVKFNLSDHTITKPMGVFKVVNGKPIEIAKIQKISSYSNPMSALISG